MPVSRWTNVRRWLRRIWIGTGLAFTLWLAWNMQARDVDPSLLESSATVHVVDSGGTLRFFPRSASPDAPGFIFLPGAMVQPTAYAPLLHAVAEAGHPVALVRLPWRNAPTPNARAHVWEQIAAITTSTPRRAWLLGGHSRGGALTAEFAGAHPDDLHGIVLIGTTHPKDASLAALHMPVTKIYGTRDCIADTTATRANARLLPPTTRFVRVDGANHSQFGWYGRQLGDCDATISREIQLQQTLDAVFAALAGLHTNNESNRSSAPARMQ